MVLFFLDKTGVVTGVPVLKYSIQIGTTLEYLLLRVGLSDRLSFLNRTLKRQMDDRAKEQKDLEHHRAVALHSAKLASLGEMAAGIIHEVTNPLAIIAGKVQRLKILVARNQQGIREESQYLDLAEGPIIRPRRFNDNRYRFGYGCGCLAKRNISTRKRNGHGEFQSY